MAVARAADTRAAERRAAEARQLVAMPALIGLKLDIAMDVAEDAGLTAVTVCRTPGDDIPLWWSNWRITGQDVPPGERVAAGRQICVSAARN